MVEHTLTARPPLGGYRETFSDTQLEERADLVIVSVAVPLGGKAALNKTIADAFGSTLPETGKITTSKDGSIRFLSMSPDQIFILLDETETGSGQRVETALEGSGYCTQQSDNWVKLRMAGTASLAALERICPVDLDPVAFPEDRVARTVLEHMGAIILREGADSFLLLSAASSAGEFLDAVRESIIRL